MEELSAYEGRVEEIIYSNEENGYAVFDFDANDEGLITCVGYIPYLKAGELLVVSGKWITHHSYGEQLKVEYFERREPTTKDAILNYLSSGVIRGIRKSTAEKIVDRFGDDTLNVIVDTPERLSEIKGITVKRAMEISKSYLSIFEKEQLILFLQKFNITPNFAVKIHDHFGDKAIEQIKKNPYVLCEQIKGISFKTADSVAQNMGISLNDNNRVKSGIKYTLSFYATSGGHTFLPRATLVSLTMKMLHVGDLEVENAIVTLLMEQQLYKDFDGEVENIFLPIFYHCEQAIGRKIKQFAGVEFSYKQTELEQEIKQIEEKTGLILEEKQKQAVITALSAGFMIITGGPGTGKTTTLNFIIQLFQSRKLDIALTAPTGRAAKRMSSLTGLEAKTIHRLLEVGYSNDELLREFVRNNDFPLEHDVIIVDEVSMVDVILMSSLLDATKKGTRVVLVGDVDQLPSVGAGNVLKDIIASEIVPVIRLDTVFRQAEESMIVVNAHRINHGSYPLYNQKDKDFFFLAERNGERIAKTVVELVKNRLPKAYGFDPVRDIQVITPMKKSAAGVHILNRELQAALNPPDKHKNEKTFLTRILREGDKVMQIKNNYDILWEKIDGKAQGQGVYNGDMGIIEKVATGSVVVIFDEEKRVSYENAMLEELELAYAITVHKSQGSEFPAVVMPVFFGAPMLMNRNLLYTAITRARDFVTLVGMQSAVEAMVDNNQETKRFSSLFKWLKCEG